MVNTVRKGNRNQRKCANQLIKEGWLVYVARRGYRGQQIDLFNLFDVIAYQQGYFRLIQVKSNYCEPDTRKALKDFLTDGHFVMKEIWVYKDYDKKNPYIEVVR